MNLEFLQKFNSSRPDVFHAIDWGQEISDGDIEKLLELAAKLPERKARICLHPRTDELTQVTILALIAPYADRLHKHPHKPEIMIPLLGTAELKIQSNGKSKEITRHLIADSRIPVSIPQNTPHALSVTSNRFVFIEIGNGPFSNDSTLYLE